MGQVSSKVFNHLNDNDKPKIVTPHRYKCRKQAFRRKTLGNITSLRKHPPFKAFSDTEWADLWKHTDAYIEELWAKQDNYIVREEKVPRIDYEKKRERVAAKNRGTY